MFCLRSWLPLLFIPTNASPLFILTFITLTYFLHRPCIYCSALLLILFLSSCNWSDRCFFDLHGDWLSPRFGPGSGSGSGSNSSAVPNANANANGSVLGAGDASLSSGLGSGSEVQPDVSLAGFALETAGSTTKALAGAVVEGAQRRFSNASSQSSVGAGQDEYIGVGAGWLRSLVGREEWTVPCIDVKVRL